MNRSQRCRGTAGLLAIWLPVFLAGCDPAAVSPGDGAATAESPAETSPAPQASAPEAQQAQPSGTAIDDPDTIYESWPQPDFVLFVTGRQHGYIEPCGCTGLANQKGGMARRHTLLGQLAERGWELIPVDVGNQVRRFGRQAEIKFQVTAEALKTMGYEAVTFGPDDLQLSSGDLVAVTAAALAGQQTPFLCANAAVLEPSWMPTHKVVERGGKRIGITAVVGDQALEKIQSDEVIKKPAKEALGDALTKLREADCDVYVLLAHATLEESELLGREFPQLDVVVSAGGHGDPLFQPERIGQDGPWLVRVGEKGMHAGLVAFFDGSEPRYQRIPLTGKFADSSDMLQLLASYQQQLQDQGLAGLQIRPQPHPSGQSFVGSQACAECHVEAYDTWKETPHFAATDSLVHPGERSEIQRHYDPECLSCHVTGWNPQRYYPYQSGYLGLEESPQMHGSGCENCHGPGAAHVAAESGDIEADDELLEKLRRAMWVPLERERCTKCHDLDNSPDFHDEGAFEEDYWPQIAH